MAHGRSICVTCRSIDKPCEHEKIQVGYRWRPPKKTDNVAWKRIAEGDILWDHNYINNRAVSNTIRFNELWFGRGKRNRQVVKTKIEEYCDCTNWWCTTCNPSEATGKLTRTQRRRRAKKT